MSPYDVINICTRVYLVIPYANQTYFNVPLLFIYPIDYPLITSVNPSNTHADGTNRERPMLRPFSERLVNHAGTFSNANDVFQVLNVDLALFIDMVCIQNWDLFNAMGDI